MTTSAAQVQAGTHGRFYLVIGRKVVAGPYPEVLAERLAPRYPNHRAAALLAALEDEEGYEGPSCSICDGLGHGYPGSGPCPLEERGWEDAEADRQREAWMGLAS